MSRYSYILAFHNKISMDSSYSSGSTKPLYRGTQIVWYLLGLLEILLAFRFILKLTGANPLAGFTSFIYGVTYVFTAPFLSVFRITRIEGSIFEWTTLLAMLVYWIVAMGIIKLLFMGKTVSTPEAAEKMNEEEV
ncbi:MAG TPA: YggT family protein [Candidatus Andersenbacteria bacterium]|nr:YggT family protein [Candidatus Andersenbacteria bacterium]